jgi:hypothetical protein
VLAPAAAMREVSRDGDQLGVDTVQQRDQTAFNCGLLRAPSVQVGDV